MSADLLRRAAAKLREHAEAASVGPWEAEADGLVWPPRIGDPVSGSTEVEDAAYIALMHPPVALALAELLDKAADVRQRVGEGTPEGGWSACVPAWIEPSLLALARAILREPKAGAL